MKPRYFKSPAKLREWFEKNHHKKTELWIGFYRTSLDKGYTSYFEALDEALCFGWIDGVRYKVDDQKYTNRFTPRTPKSNWSRRNIQNVSRLKREGRMAPSGLAAFNQAKADGRIK